MQSTKSLQDKVVLVTGAAGGLGGVMARRLAQQGAVVAAHARQPSASLDTLLSTIQSDGGSAAPFTADLTDTEAIRRMVEAVVARHGRIDILVNNAGIGSVKFISEVTPQHYRDTFDANVWGTVATTQACLPRIPSGGRIINISSVAARGGPAGLSMYAASKAAVDSFTRTMAQELGPRNITVNSIAPNSVPTRMTAWIPKPMWGQIQMMTALRRLGTAEDIADVVVWLAGDGARWISGKIIEADGGWAM